MTEADIRTLGYRVYEAINARDIATLEALFDPQIVRHAVCEVGIEYARRALENAYARAPEQKFLVEDVLVDGDKAALRVTVEGIPTSPGQPVPTILEIFRIKNGRVVEIWGAGNLHLPDA